MRTRLVSDEREETSQKTLFQENMREWRRKQFCDDVQPRGTLYLLFISSCVRQSTGILLLLEGASDTDTAKGISLYKKRQEFIPNVKIQTAFDIHSPSSDLHRTPAPTRCTGESSSTKSTSYGSSVDNDCTGASLEVKEEKRYRDKEKKMRMRSIQCAVLAPAAVQQQEMKKHQRGKEGRRTVQQCLNIHDQRK